MNSKIKVPFLLELILKIFTSEKEFSFLCGDMAESYIEISASRGKFSAITNYILCILRLIPNFFIKNIEWSSTLVLNYIKTALRNLGKNKVFSTINILSFAFGLSIFFIIMQFYDIVIPHNITHKNTYALVQVLNKTDVKEEHTAMFPIYSGKNLKNEIAGIKNISLFKSIGFVELEYKGRKFTELGTLTDKNMLSMYKMELLVGNKNTFLNSPDNIVLTDRIAKKLFGDKDPIGKIIKVNGKDTKKVTGIISHPPDTYMFRYGFLMPLNPDKFSNEEIATFFVNLEDNVTIEEVEASFPNFIKKNFTNEKLKPKSMYLFNLNDVPFDGAHVTGPWAGSPQVIIYMLIGIAFALLIIVSFNYTNMASARYLTRAKEIGLRKVCGARQSTLMIQFLCESILVTFIASPIAILFATIIKPHFWANFGIMGTAELWENPLFLLKLIAAVITVGILSGSYPAFILTKLDPVKIIRGQLTKGKKGAKIRKILIAAQFVLSIVLISYSSYITIQNDHIESLDPGFTKKNCLTAVISREEGNKKIDVLLSNLKNIPSISEVAVAEGVPGVWYDKSTVFPEGFPKERPFIMSCYKVGKDFIKTMNINLIEGSDFSQLLGDRKKIIIPESTAKLLGWKDPIGKTITVQDKELTTYKVIAIAKDYQFLNITAGANNLMPSLIVLDDNTPNNLIVKYNLNITKEDRTILHNEIKKVYSEFDGEINSIEELIEFRLKGYRNFHDWILYISIIALLFSCIGICGLSYYSTRRRIQEIGVRKVLGASIFSLVKNLLKETISIAVISVLISAPVSYLVVSAILKNYFGRFAIDISLIPFVGVSFIILLTSVASVLYYTLKAAHSNPVEVLSEN